MFRFSALASLLFCPIGLHAQDSICARVIMIGNAGNAGKTRDAVIAEAAKRIIPGKTTVLYLGDNIFPSGLGASGTASGKNGQEILQSAWQPMRRNDAKVFFIPGNHDWDATGPQGLAKIKAQWSFIESQQDAGLKLVPANGCPDPVEINISDSLTIIAFDSEWWLFPFTTVNPGAECGCKTKKDITEKMRELLYKNRFKVILLASHHPFESYGNHGGYFSWEDHIFPLNAAVKGFYLPLPLVGSLYPVLRNTFPGPEDAGHPLYRMMKKEIGHVFENTPNLVHVSAHDNGMQLINSLPLQLVTGAGADKSYVKKGRHALYASGDAGFVVADLLTGNQLKLSFYNDRDPGAQPQYSYKKTYVTVKDVEDSSFHAITGDSAFGIAHAGFGNVSGLHRSLFGENYRKEWSAETKLPVIRLSEIHGGLTPMRQGGGNQTQSLRLEDKDGAAWVLRSVEKYPEAILPDQLKETFAKDIVTDAMSAQHPYSALAVPPLANALHVPHAHPQIGIVAPDKNLGMYTSTFSGKICLLEEREPGGKSVNFTDMLDALTKDNDNDFDSSTFLRARILDIFLGDWDRHGDQWRFRPEKNGNGKRYVSIPRDRDQAFYTNQGVFPSLESLPWIEPFFEGFNPKIRNAGTLLFTSTLLNARLINQFSYAGWMQITNECVAALTDSVLEASLRQLPQSSYFLRHDKLLKIMKGRRADLPRAMGAYYRFLNKNALIQLSDKNELVEIKDAAGGATEINIHKLSKKGELRQQLFSKTYDPSVTKEVRVFLAAGNDSVIINKTHSPVKIRISGGDGDKKFEVTGLARRVTMLKNDTAIVPGNLFNVLAPLASAGFNNDDGFILGLGFRCTRGLDYKTTTFTTRHYTSFQQLTVAHSFSSQAFNVKYSSEWIHAIGKADIVIRANAFAPDNTQNFFGTGNQTAFVKAGDFKRFYRARFSLYTLDPALRWENGKGTSISFGPSFQYYRYDSSDNIGRFIQTPGVVSTYDSNSVGKSKIHGGIAIHFVHDTRNSKLLPAWGSYLNIRLKGYAGLNNAARSYGELSGDFAVFKSVDAKSNVVIVDRIGGSVLVGNPAFYQTAFLGGQGNLYGYRQYRFAGKYMLFNNLETHIKLADFASYILPGQVGLVGLFDIGRVWTKNDDSNQWHNGAGGGIYFSPAQVTVIQLIAVHSVEGWYPYLTVGFRF